MYAARVSEVHPSPRAAPPLFLSLHLLAGPLRSGRITNNHGVNDQIYGSVTYGGADRSNYPSFFIRINWGTYLYLKSEA